jgi:teichuronic acid biosynthesis glycosyltransferase TuaG
MKLVSIIMPYYKKIYYVQKAIDSVQKQSYQNYELLIIYDDTDLSDLHRLHEITKKNSKIKIIKNKKNLGAGHSRNVGIKESAGEFIAFIDADDEWDAEKVYKQINFMSNNNHNFNFCNYRKKIYNKIIEVISDKKFLNYEDLLTSCVIGLSTVIVRKNIIDENLFPKLKTQEDFVAWLKITKDNHKAYNLNEILVTWNFDRNSLSTNYYQKIKDAFLVYRKYQNFSFIKSIYFVLVLSINSLRRKF